MKPTEHLHQWLKQKSPPWRIGQLLIFPHYHLIHSDDVPSSIQEPSFDSLKKIEDWPQWRSLLFFNPEGAFRPLKASPDLPSGWHFGPLDFSQLCLALQYAYPLGLAAWSFHQQGQLTSTPYTETAQRQTGRFQIVQKLTTNDLQDLTHNLCDHHCLKHRLWHPFPSPAPSPQESEIPLYCPEACNYFVSKAREKIKGS